MAKSAAAVADKWSRNLAASTDSIKAGVNAVTVNPAQLAAAAQDRYVQGVQNAVNSGKYAAGLQRVTLASWQGAMLGKGLARIASGANDAKPKMQNFMQQWLPYMDQLKQKLANTPRGDLSTNIQRMIDSVQFAAAFRKSAQ